MNAAEWETMWGGKLIRAAASDVEQLPPLARRFLVDYGFPKRVALVLSETTFEPLWGDFDPLTVDEYGRVAVFGADIDGGAYLYVNVNPRTEAVTMIDVDAGSPEFFVNSDLPKFGECVLIASQWYERYSGDGEPTEEDIEAFATALKTLDPAAFFGDETYWSGIVDMERHGVA